jgi:hypothetical protein
MEFCRFRSVGVFVLVSLLALAGVAQQQSASTSRSLAPSTVAAVPTFINYNGVVSDLNRKPLSGVTGVTFLLYQDQQGGAPLWMETQNVAADKSGRYTATLGATRREGLPADLFSSEQARWLAVQIAGQAEQPRVLLVAVPYALKAADAQTLGGLPASAFVLAAPVSVGEAVGPASGSSVAASEAVPPPATSNVTTTGGTINTLPLWTTATNIQSSAITQLGSGTTAKIGINTTAPVGALDVKGSVIVRGLFNLPVTGNATASAGKNSQAESFAASAFNSTSSSAVNQAFRLQAEPAGNNSAAPSGTLNLLFAQGAATPAETGLKIASNGRITFAAGQTFPGAGTVKSVGLTAPASDFNVAGSPVTGAGTLGVTWKVAPTSANTANAIVKRDSTSSFQAGNITLSGAINASGTITATTNNLYGVAASTSATNGTAIIGDALASTGQIYGVEGTTASASNNAAGVFGSARAFASDAGYTFGVLGQSKSPVGVGVFGYGVNASDTANALLGHLGGGIWGDSESSSGAAVVGTATGGANAFFGISSSTVATAYFYNSTDNKLALRAGGSGGECRIDTFGDLACKGTITASATNFKIDHPLDPANKYLVQRGWNRLRPRPCMTELRCSTRRARLGFGCQRMPRRSTKISAIN